MRGVILTIRAGVLLIIFFNMVSAPSAYGEILAEVNKMPISDVVVDETLQSYLRQIGHRKLSQSRMYLLRREILKKLIEEELLFQDGLKSGVSVTEEEINDGVGAIRNRFSSTEAFQKGLSTESLSMGDIRKGVYRSILIQKTWDVFSEMNEPGRQERLKKITKQAEIRIYEDGMTAVGYR